MRTEVDGRGLPTRSAEVRRYAMGTCRHGCPAAKSRLQSFAGAASASPTLLRAIRLWVRHPQGAARSNSAAIRRSRAPC